MTDETQAEPPDAAPDAALHSNFERLIAHLRKDSLAEKLVSAYAAAGEGNAAQAVEDVMAGRLDELKSAYDAPADQQD